MTKSHTARLVAGLLLLTSGTAVVTTASAQSIAIYTANANPTTEGFGLWPFNGGIQTAALANDQGRPAFQIQSTGSSNEQAYYTMLGGTGPFGSGGLGSGLTAAQASAISTQGFTLSFEARVVAGPVLGVTGLFSIDATVAGFNGARYDINLGSDGTGNTTVVLPTSTNFNGIQFTGIGQGVPLIVGGTGYHLYQLSYDPGTASAALYIDGVKMSQGYGGSNVSGGATANNYGLAFGSVNNATGNFSLVQLSLGQISVVPEPASAALTISGMTLLVGCLVRRRRFASLPNLNVGDVGIGVRAHRHGQFATNLE